LVSAVTPVLRRCRRCCCFPPPLPPLHPFAPLCFGIAAEGAIGARLFGRPFARNFHRTFT
jgi:hypothetical protein